MSTSPPDRNMNEPEPEEPGSAWLELMEQDSEYLYEALGDNPKDMDELIRLIHWYTYKPLDKDDLATRIRDIVEGTLTKYAAAKEEAGEELP